MTAAYILLLSAMVTAWYPRPIMIGVWRIPLWVPVFLGALCLALRAQIVVALGVLPLGALALLLVLAEALERWDKPKLRRIARFACVCIVFGLAIQIFPGFTETVVVGPLQLSSDAAPMRIALRFDAGVAGLLMLALFCRPVRSSSALRGMARPTLAIGSVTIAVVLSAALLMGYVRFDPKLPEFTALYLAKTLWGTAVLEEALFRGIIQSKLESLCKSASVPIRRFLPIILSALIFGFAHFRGGWPLMLLASTAGLGYALAFRWSDTIEAPILVHFSLNAVHFLAFSYPNLTTTP